MMRTASPVVRIARASKFNARKTEIDGIVFDSQAEAHYYEELKHRQAMGEITGLKVHPKYTLLESFKDPYTGKTVRGITYEADFSYTEGGQRIAEDVKAIQTEAFKLRWKLARYHYPETQWRIVDTKKGRGK